MKWAASVKLKSPQTGDSSSSELVVNVAAIWLYWDKQGNERVNQCSDEKLINCNIVRINESDRMLNQARWCTWFVQFPFENKRN